MRIRKHTNYFFWKYIWFKSINGKSGKREVIIAVTDNHMTLNYFLPFADYPQLIWLKHTFILFKWIFLNTQNNSLKDSLMSSKCQYKPDLL